MNFSVQIHPQQKYNYKTPEKSLYRSFYQHHCRRLLILFYFA